VIIQETENIVAVDIYVAAGCEICHHAYEIAALIRQRFPQQVDVRIIDIGQTTEPIPEAVFATPTYLLNGRRWSLGNPSTQEVVDTLAKELAGLVSR
jgi:hypothetical protein